jgi:hypothetical protein
MSDAKGRTHDPDALELLAEAAELYEPDWPAASVAGAALLEELKALDGLTKIRIVPASDPTHAQVVMLQAGAVRVWIRHLEGGQFDVIGANEEVGVRVGGLRYNPVSKEIEEDKEPTPPAKRRRAVALVLEAALLKAHKIRFPDAYRSAEPRGVDRWPPITNTGVVPRRRR